MSVSRECLEFSVANESLLRRMAISRMKKHLGPEAVESLFKTARPTGQIKPNSSQATPNK